MNLKLREFQDEDIKAMAELTTQLGYPTTIEEIEIRMDKIYLQPNSKTIVAELNSEVVGYLGMTKNIPWESNDSFLRIQALIVSENFRKLGIGKLLIEYAVRRGGYACKIQAKSIALNCGNRSERESAHKFYPKLGFEAKSTGYKKFLF